MYNVLCMKSASRRAIGAFTLIELLIVMAILSVLSVVVVFVINPPELLRQGRDATRLSAIETLNKSIGFYQVDVPAGSLGTALTTYVSIADFAATTPAGTDCTGVGLPPLPSLWSYHCPHPSNVKKIDGTGWLPLNFIGVNGRPNTLPIDPINTTSSGLYYAYVPGGRVWAFTAPLESKKYLRSTAQKDGGVDDARFEAGADVSLWSSALGLMGLWRLDEGSGTGAADQSGNTNIGILTNGPTWASGKVGGAINLDGVDDYVDIPNSASLNLTTAITVNAWVYVTGGGARRTIATKSGTWTTGTGFWFMIEDNVVYFDMRSSTHDVSYDAGAGLYNDWHNIVATYDEATDQAKLYLDGDLKTTATVVNVLNGNSNNVWIGRRGDLAEYYGGRIDDVRIYSRALSAAEIQAIYGAMK